MDNTTQATPRCAPTQGRAGPWRGDGLRSELTGLPILVIPEPREPIAQGVRGGREDLEEDRQHDVATDLYDGAPRRDPGSDALPTATASERPSCVASIRMRTVSRAGANAESVAKQSNASLTTPFWFFLRARAVL